METGQGADSIGCEFRLMPRVICLAIACVLAACVPAGVMVKAAYSGAMTPPGVTRVILRAAAARNGPRQNSSARVCRSPFQAGPRVERRAIIPRTRNGERHRPADWGLDFVASRFGATLVISSKNEVGYIHHHYVIADIVLQLPASVELVRRARNLSGSGEPDLTPPIAR